MNAEESKAVEGDFWTRFWGGVDNNNAKEATMNAEATQEITKLDLSPREVEKAVNHDPHYASQKIEPIDVIEQVAENIEQTSLNAKQKILVLQGLKYLLRLGTKDDAIKELNKAENYLHRALNGEWR